VRRASEASEGGDAGSHLDGDHDETLDGDRAVKILGEMLTLISSRIAEVASMISEKSDQELAQQQQREQAQQQAEAAPGGDSATVAVPFFTRPSWYQLPGPLLLGRAQVMLGTLEDERVEIWRERQRLRDKEQAVGGEHAAAGREVDGRPRSRTTSRPGSRLGPRSTASPVQPAAVIPAVSTTSSTSPPSTGPTLLHLQTRLMHLVGDLGVTKTRLAALDREEGGTDDDFHPGSARARLIAAKLSQEEAVAQVKQEIERARAEAGASSGTGDLHASAFRPLGGGLGSSGSSGVGVGDNGGGGGGGGGGSSGTRVRAASMGSGPVAVREASLSLSDAQQALAAQTSSGDAIPLLLSVPAVGVTVTLSLPSRLSADAATHRTFAQLQRLGHFHGYAPSDFALWSSSSSSLDHVRDERVLLGGVGDVATLESLGVRPSDTLFLLLAEADGGGRRRRTVEPVQESDEESSAEVIDVLLPQNDSPSSLRCRLTVDEDSRIEDLEADLARGATAGSNGRRRLFMSWQGGSVEEFPRDVLPLFVVRRVKGSGVTFMYE